VKRENLFEYESDRKNGIQHGLKSGNEVKKYRKCTSENTGKVCAKNPGRKGIFASRDP